MNVLSLFDGMSCGRIALERAGIKVNNYYSSEIDQGAICVANDNYPQDKENRLGNILDLSDEYLLSLNIDLLIGGSPCQGFSLAGTKKGSSTKCGIDVTSLAQYLELKNENFQFQGQSYLFWEFVRIYELLKPKYFFLENVRITKKWLPMFNKAMKVEPIIINSDLVTFQNRVRFYWTNIEYSKDIKDNKTYLKDNYCKDYDESLILKGRGLNKLDRHRNRMIDINSDKCGALLKAQDKLPTDSLVFKIGEDKYRYPTRTECEKMQTVPIGYTKAVNYRVATGMLGNGWTVDVIAHIFKGIKED